MTSPTRLARGVHRFEKVKPSGWSLSMLAIELGGGKLLLHSPTWLGDGTFEQIEKLGQPAALLAPNHYHHVHLKRFRERYPDAPVLAASGAIPRLTKQGHQGLTEATSRADLLPAGASWVTPQGLSNGEIWLSVPGDEGPTLVVSDAFFNIERPVSGFEGFMLRRLAIVPSLRVGRTFRWVGVADRKAYLGSLERHLADHPPAVLALSHGEPATGPDLARRMLDASLARLG